MKKTKNQADLVLLAEHYVIFKVKHLKGSENSASQKLY